MAGQQTQAWALAENLMGTTLAKNYEQAVTLLVDLKELAQREGRVPEAQKRIDDLRTRFARKRTLIERMDRAGLV